MPEPKIIVTEEEVVRLNLRLLDALARLEAAESERDAAMQLAGVDIVTLHEYMRSCREERMHDTGYTIAGWHVMLAPSGVFIRNGAEVAPYPDPSGEHPANWHEVHGYTARCPYCYAAANPEEVRAIRGIVEE